MSLKKIICLALVVIMTLSIVSCSGKTFEETTDYSSGKTPEEKAFDTVVKYVKENGELDDDGSYSVVDVYGEVPTYIGYYPDENELFFYISDEFDDTEMYAFLNYDPKNNIQDVGCGMTLDSAKFDAEGTVDITTFSSDAPVVNDIKYTDTFKSSVKAEAKELIYEGASSCVGMLLASVNILLLEDVGISIQDLGFENW